MLWPAAESQDAEVTAFLTKLTRPREPRRATPATAGFVDRLGTGKGSLGPPSAGLPGRAPGRLSGP